MGFEFMDNETKEEAQFHENMKRLPKGWVVCSIAVVNANQTHSLNCLGTNSEEIDKYLVISRYSTNYSSCCSNGARKSKSIKNLPVVIRIPLFTSDNIKKS